MSGRVQPQPPQVSNPPPQQVAQPPPQSQPSPQIPPVNSYYLTLFVHKQFTDDTSDVTIYVWLLHIFLKIEFVYGAIEAIS